MKPQRRAVLACLLTSLLMTAACAVKRTASPRLPGESAEALLARAAGFAANAQFDGANFFLGKAVDVLILEQRWPEAMRGLVQIGNNWQKLGSLDLAKQAFSKALEIAFQHDEIGSLELSRSILQLAFKLMVRREYDEALTLLNRSLTTLRQRFGPEHPEMAKIYNSLALLHLNMGETQKATEYASKSLSARMRGLLRGDGSMVRDYTFMDGIRPGGRPFADISGALDKSLGVYLESLGSGHPLVASIYEKLGMVCALQGDHEQGLEYFRKALRILTEAVGEGNVRVAVLYEEIGICLRLQGDLDNARRYLRQALAIAQKAPQPAVLASIHFQAGKVDFLQNRLDDALQSYQLSLTALASRFAVSDSPSDVTTATERQGMMEILAAQAETYAARSRRSGTGVEDLQAAFYAIRGAVQLIGRLRADFRSEGYRLRFGAKSRHVLELAVNIALELFRATGNDIYRESAFAFSERSKAALLTETMLESEARQFAGIPAERLARERDLRDELVQSEMRFEEDPSLAPAAGEGNAEHRQHFYTLLGEYQDLIRSFERDYPRYYELKFGGERASASAVQRSLPERAVLVEYFLAPDRLHIFILSRDRFQVVSQPLEAGFSETVSAFCLAVKKIDEIGFLRLSPKLYQVLVAPLEERLDGMEQLIIIPDGILASLPFEALVRDPPPGSDFSRLDFLIRRVDVSYLFSTRLPLAPRQGNESDRTGSWAGFAPVFSRSAAGGSTLDNRPPNSDPVASRMVTVGEHIFPELPGTEEELRSIIGLFAAQDRKAVGFFRSQATETIFKSRAMRDFSMIHLATHTLTDENNPHRSGFLFHPPGGEEAGEDGILYAGETYSLDLDCDLLVLSSCESGSGRLVEGEGMLALTRGLYYSGARSIVFSLWNVEDRTTGELMVGMYREILRGEPLARALAKAKQALIANPYSAFPKYWAGFILLGR